MFVTTRKGTRLISSRDKQMVLDVEWESNFLNPGAVPSDSDSASERIVLDVETIVGQERIARLSCGCRRHGRRLWLAGP